MSKYDVLGLYDHNIKSYEKIKQGFLDSDIVSIVHATGTGKSYNALQLAYDNKDMKITYIVPSKSIIEHLKEIIEENENLDVEVDFPNLEFITYQSLVNMSDDEILELNIDLLILDEFHHIGAPVWGNRINKIVESHEDIKILGMTAYTVRDRGTSYERDMVDSNGSELFSNSVVSNYDLCDAMIDGVLPKPIYRSGYVYFEETANALEWRLEELNHESNDYKELYPILKDIKKRLHEAPGVKDFFKTNIKPDGKYIYFCPGGALENRNDIATIMEESKRWISEMGLFEDEYELYLTTSDMGEIGKKNRKAFYNDEDLEGNKVDNKLRIMFAINQYNEGVHAPGLDGVIMGRGTQSDIVFFEQLGRALSVRGRTKEEYDKLYAKSIEELVEMCNKRKIQVNDINSKEDIIEQLLAPVIIDLANNIGFIKELENNLKDRVRDIIVSNSNDGERRIIRLGNTSFDIDMINEDLFEVIKYMTDRLSDRWMSMYELAKKYYEYHGNLEISQGFKTINGYDKDEDGKKLGIWIREQRSRYQGKNGYKLTKEQVKLLESIGMRFELINNENEWYKKYELAKKYYEVHGDLEIPSNFKTINGYEYDEDGIKLGIWIKNLRKSYHGKGTHKITKERVELLENIGMRFEARSNESEWYKKYELANKYYEYHGNLEIPRSFKTINGYEYDENGINLGEWIKRQRDAFNGIGKEKITEEQIKLLKSIGMRFESNYHDIEWYKKYKLAKKYYEVHGNLEIPRNFKTINGYEYDENGINLGNWIVDQRSGWYGKGTRKITEERIKLLESIGMRFETRSNEDEWHKKYELAKKYYEYYGNLEIPRKFKTINGYEEDYNGIALGEWIIRQRDAFYGKGAYKITEERIKLLESIGMKWYGNDKVDDKVQREEINEENIIRKEIELFNRIRSLLNKYSGDSLPTKEEFNQGMLDELNHITKRK